MPGTTRSTSPPSPAFPAPWRRGAIARPKAAAARTATSRSITLPRPTWHAARRGTPPSLRRGPPGCARTFATASASWRAVMFATVEAPHDDCGSVLSSISRRDSPARSWASARASPGATLSRSRIRSRPLARPLAGSPRERGAHSLRQCLGSERLAQELSLVDARHGRPFGKTGDEEDRQRRLAQARETGDFRPVHPWHGEIDDHQIEPMGVVDQVERRAAAAGLEDKIAELVQH